MSYNLFLDDERVPHKTTWVSLPSYNDWDWVIVRNFDQFVAAIRERGLPNFISFDHDLAEEHYNEGRLGLPPRKDYKEKTGMSCANWLINYCVSSGVNIPPFAVHSFNPVGRENIRKALEAGQKYIADKYRNLVPKV
jgi:hypothetical protein